MISIETYDSNNNQYLIDDALSIKWSNHYSHEGSGYGYFTFDLKRQTGFTYNDITLGNRLTCRKYLNTILFDGQIRKVEEMSSLLPTESYSEHFPILSTTSGARYLKYH